MGYHSKVLCIIASHVFLQFRRYHQSEIMLRGRSCLKEGWWAGGMEVQVQGQPALIRRYDDPKAKVHRVNQSFFTQAHVVLICSSAMAKRCQNASKPVVSFQASLVFLRMSTECSHPNLPQMLGFSDDETPTPFILLSNGERAPQIACSAEHRAKFSEDADS